MKKVLTEYKYTWTNTCEAESGSLSQGYTLQGKYLNNVTLPTKSMIINGESVERVINGSERVEYWENINNILNECKEDGQVITTHLDEGFNPLGYTIALHREQWIWNGYDGEGSYSLYKADVWSNFVTIWSGIYEFNTLFPEGCPYQIYLYQIGCARGWGLDTGFDSDRSWPTWISSPWGKIITCQSGNVDSSGIIKERISLPGVGFTIDTSIKSSIPVSEFYSSKTIDTNGNYVRNDKELTKKAYISCRYLPLVVVDISSKLKMF